MLKFTYTENSTTLELLAESLESWVTTRVILAIRIGVPLNVEPSSASFFLPDNLKILAELEAIANEDERIKIEIYEGDEDNVEITLKGVWLVSDPLKEEGVFVTSLSNRTEFLLFQFWLETKVGEPLSMD